jgi:hypothetical protein
MVSKSGALDVASRSPMEKSSVKVINEKMDVVCEEGKKKEKQKTEKENQAHVRCCYGAQCNGLVK